MDYYKEIKNELLNNEVYRKTKEYSINKNDLTTYYNVGKMLNEAGKHYGEEIIKTYSIKLTRELGKGYNISALTRIRNFFALIEKLATVSQVLSYSHYVELLPIDNLNQIKYYIRITEQQNLSVRQLREKIKNKEYERLPIETKNKLIEQKEIDLTDYIKNPIIIKNKNNFNEITEKVLQRIILEDIDNFLEELGEGFSYIGSEYKIKIGNSYNYIDLLLFNYIYNSFVVVELKVTELKKEHIGQIEIYMNYVDKNLKKEMHNKTIGLIIVRKNNRFVLEYSSDKRILAKEYIII